MSEYFPQPNLFRRSVKIELDLSSYESKSDLKMQQVLIHQNLLKPLI